ALRNGQLVCARAWRPVGEHNRSSSYESLMMTPAMPTWCTDRRVGAPGSVPSWSAGGEHWQEDAVFDAGDRLVRDGLAAGGEELLQDECGPGEHALGGEGLGTDLAAFCPRCHDHPERALAWLDDALPHSVGEFGVLVAVAEATPHGGACGAGHD